MFDFTTIYRTTKNNNLKKTYSQQIDNFKNNTASTKNKYYENSLVNSTNVSKTCNVFVDY